MPRRGRRTKNWRNFSLAQHIFPPLKFFWPEKSPCNLMPRPRRAEEVAALQSQTVPGQYFQLVQACPEHPPHLQANPRFPTQNQAASVGVGVQPGPARRASASAAGDRLSHALSRDTERMPCSLCVIICQKTRIYFFQKIRRTALSFVPVCVFKNPNTRL